MMSATTTLASDFGTFFTASCLCLMGSSPGGGGREERGEKGVVYTKVKSVWHYLYSNMFMLSEDRASSEVPIGHVMSVQSPNTH